MVWQQALTVSLRHIEAQTACTSSHTDWPSVSSATPTHACRVPTWIQRTRFSSKAIPVLSCARPISHSELITTSFGLQINQIWMNTRSLATSMKTEKNSKLVWRRHNSASAMQQRAWARTSPCTSLRLISRQNREDRLPTAERFAPSLKKPTFLSAMEHQRSCNQKLSINLWPRDKAMQALSPNMPRTWICGPSWRATTSLYASKSKVDRWTTISKRLTTRLSTKAAIQTTTGHASPNLRRETLTRNTIISALTSPHSSHRERGKLTISSSRVTAVNTSRRLGAWTLLPATSHPTMPVTLWCKRLWSRTSKSSAMWPLVGHLPHRKVPWATAKPATSRSSVGSSQKLDEKEGLNRSGSPSGLWPRHTHTNEFLLRICFTWYRERKSKRQNC